MNSEKINRPQAGRESVAKNQLYSVVDARARLGDLGNSTFYKLVQEGRLKTVKLGRRTFVTADELNRFISAMEGGVPA